METNSGKINILQKYIISSEPSVFLKHNWESINNYPLVFVGKIKWGPELVSSGKRIGKDQRKSSSE